jgi:hypothetical protein
MTPGQGFEFVQSFHGRRFKEAAPLRPVGHVHRLLPDRPAAQESGGSGPAGQFNLAPEYCEIGSG